MSGQQPRGRNRAAQQYKLIQRLRKHLRVSRKANCANRYEKAKLPAEMQEVPVKMLPPTGENAKGTGENEGRTSEEPLSEPHIEPLKEEAAPPSSFGNDVRRCSGRKKGVGRAKRAKEDWSQ
jgi:hypothetical protein